MNVLAFLLLSLLLGARSEPVTFSPPDGETLRNMVFSDSGLVLGSSHALRRLSPDLQVQQSTSLPADQPNRLLAGDPGGTYSGSVMACHRTDCELLDMGDLSHQRWRASNVLLDGSYNAHGLFVIGPSGSSVFTAALRNEGFTKSRILRGDLVNVDQVIVSRASRIFRWDERAGKNTSGHSDQLSVNLRRNVGGSNLIGSLEIKHMTSGIPIILTVYFYLASVKYCLCVCNGCRLRYCNCSRFSGLHNTRLHTP